MRCYKSYDRTGEDARRNQLEDEWQEVHRMFRLEEVTAEGTASGKKTQMSQNSAAVTVFSQACGY